MTPEAAQDEMLGLFRAAWEALSPAVVSGPVPDVQWPGDTSDDPPPAKCYARVAIRHRPSGQRTFGPVGQRRFERPGDVHIQCFAPVSLGDGLTIAENLAIIARNAFEGVGTASGLIFRNSHTRYVGIDKAHHQYNMTVEFQFDETR